MEIRHLFFFWWSDWQFEHFRGQLQVWWWFHLGHLGFRSSKNYEIMNAVLDIKSAVPNLSCLIFLEIRSIIFVLLIRDFIYLFLYNAWEEMVWGGIISINSEALIVCVCVFCLPPVNNYFSQKRNHCLAFSPAFYLPWSNACQLKYKLNCVLVWLYAP